MIAEFVTGFELKAAPPLAIERARTAFVDTVGVTLAGSTEKVAEIVRDMVRAEGASPGGVGDRLAAEKTSPQLAALANGVASHALDFDFTYTQGQLMAPVIPALLPLAEQRARRLGGAGGLHRRLRGLLAARAAPTRPTTAAAPGTAPAPSARSRRRRPARGC